MKKRSVCIILALALLLSLLPVSASAAAAAYYERVDALAENGEYVLVLRDETVVRGGTLFTFTMDGTVDGSYSIKGGPGYLYATRSAMSCTSSTVSAQASWTLTMDELGNVTLRNNTSSLYYILFSEGAFTVSKTAGDPLALYDAEGTKLTAIPAGPFEAYIGSADGGKFLSDEITTDDPVKTILAEYVLSAELTLHETKLLGRRARSIEGAGLFRYRDGKLYSTEEAGLNEALSPEGAPDAASYADGRLKIGEQYLNVKGGALGLGSQEDASSVQLWERKATPEQDGTYLAITSDIHYKFKEDFAVDSETGEVVGTITSVERMEALLNQASEDFGGVYFDQLVSCGDQGDANTRITGANYWERVRVPVEFAANYDKVLGGGFFINGNHEWANGQYSSLGTTNEVAKQIHLAGYVEEASDYVLYSLSCSSTNNSFNASDITALDNYLKTAPKDKPIFVVSHFPLHNFNRTEQRRDDLINVLNSYADDLQIIFLWGHNHTEEDPFYGVVYQGDNVPADMEITTPIKFAYVSAGCMTDDEYDVHAVFTTPKALIAYIAPDRSVTLTYYDVNYQQMSTTTVERPANYVPHEHNYTAVVTEPTCTEGGCTTYTCECGESYVGDEVEPLGHDLGEWTQTTAPTCTEPGEEAQSCSRCDLRETRPVEALGHDFKDGVCTRCGAEDPDYEPPKPVNPFADVKEGSYCYDPVLWAVGHEPQITNGVNPTHFDPDKTCNRAQVVTFLWRAMGCPEPEKTDNPFKDVKPDAYYCKAVLWAVEQGVTNGTGSDTFSPGKGCTRAQVVTFLWRAEHEPEPSESGNPFKDVKPGYYYTAVLWAVERKITNGLSATKFGPDATCTRGQIVTFLYRDMN